MILTFLLVSILPIGLVAQTIPDNIELREPINKTVYTLLSQLSSDQILDSNSANRIKCGMPITAMVHQHQSELSEETLALYESAFPAKNITSESYVSASGKFTIFYETTGIDAVPLGDANTNSIPDYVEWVAEAADSSYRHEVLTLGFTDPIPSGYSYEIYIIDANYYGATRPDNNPAGTIIEIENDFVRFPSNTDPEGDQKGAVKVTMAHEFKHAIQYVENKWRGNSNSWAEMDATLYEEVVYDDVNDYYNYLEDFGSNFFGRPTSSLISGSYEDIAWALFFHDRFGDAFWTNTWKRIKNDTTIPFLDAIAEELTNYDITFQEAVIENFVWHYTSGPFKSAPNFGFDERLFYPTPRVTEQFVKLQEELSDSISFTRFSGRYYEVDLDTLNKNGVKIEYIPTSADIQLGLVVYNSNKTVDYFLYTEPIPFIVNTIEPNLYYDNIDSLGVLIFNSSDTKVEYVQLKISENADLKPDTFTLQQNYPNPFNPSTTIEVNLSYSQPIKLTVYNYLGREIQVLRDETMNSGTNYIRFDATGLASGVYFYRLQTQESVITKKMTLIK